MSERVMTPSILPPARTKTRLMRLLSRRLAFGVRIDRDHAAGHDVGGDQAMGLDEFAGLAVGIGQDRHPPGLLALGPDLDPAQQVALADHAQRHAAVVDDRHRADAVVDQECGERPHRGFRADRQHLPGHHVAGLEIGRHPVLLAARLAPSASSCDRRTQRAMRRPAARHRAARQDAA
jgi:hypothetical protein